MYIPPSFAETDQVALHEFMDAHPLATIVTTMADTRELFATHIPLLLDRSAGPFGALAGHVARANPHARHLIARPDEALIIFTGPNAYITPTWYQTKAETGRVVPTWNYIAVHAYGTITVREEPEFLHAHLTALTQRHESSRPVPWQVTDAPEDYIAQQMRAIVGIEIRIARLEGKWKMSQNRPAADIDGVVAGLNASGTPGNREVATHVNTRRPTQ